MFAKGIILALGACFIWGLIFVVPEFMSGFNSLEVALGRHSVYGLTSLLVFLRLRYKGLGRHPKPIWLKALYFSLISTVGYYTFVVLALRYSTPAICALILGVSPIAIAFYGNWKQKEVKYRSLILPSILILIGLIIINVPHFKDNAAPTNYIIGLGCAFLALVAWSWYVVANARFLKQHKEVHPSDWSTLIGVVTLFWVALFSIILFLFFKGQLNVEKLFVFTPELRNFLIGSAILGIICSWVGAVIWNRASFYLPVSIAGQMTIFETLFAVLFFYIIEKRWPPLLEGIGMVLLLIAVVYGVGQFSKNKKFNNELTPH